MATFTIYSTGCADNTADIPNRIKFGLLKIFLDTLCTNITRSIPDNFTNIEIYHHDIILYAELINLSREQVSYTLNQMIKESTLSLDPRITIHHFDHTELDMIQLAHPHLIIDMAHIFSYSTEKTTWWNHHYDHLYECPTIRIEMMPINSIYIGWNNTHFAQKKLVEISPYGYVRTFIHCLEDSGFINHRIEDPVKLLEEIIQQLKSNLMKMWREKKGNVKSTDAGGHFDEMFCSFSIMDKILEKLFNNRTRDEILDKSTYSFYDNFIEKLNDSECI